MDVAEHPAALETKTVKLPALVTDIDCVVAPFDHKYCGACPAVKTTVSPGQFGAELMDELVAAGGCRVMIC